MRWQACQRMSPLRLMMFIRRGMIFPAAAYKEAWPVTLTQSLGNCWYLFGFPIICSLPWVLRTQWFCLFRTMSQKLLWSLINKTRGSWAQLTYEFKEMSWRGETEKVYTAMKIREWGKNESVEATLPSAKTNSQQSCSSVIERSELTVLLQLL